MTIERNGTEAGNNHKDNFGLDTVTQPVAQEVVVRLAVLQRICPRYRVSLFRQLSQTDGIDALLFIGSDLPHSKASSSQDLSGISYKKLKTRFIKCGSRMLPWHVGLVQELRRFKPDVVLCEGESHFIGYLQAIYYRAVYDRTVALIHWCFVSIPGQAKQVWSPRFLIKRYFRRFFDAFLLYSSYSRERLLELGQPSEKIFVATNVGNVQEFLDLSAALPVSQVQARASLNLPQKFTVLYVGTLDDAKFPEVMLDLAVGCDTAHFNFVLLGSGPALNRLRERAAHENLSNVFLPGRVDKTLPLYCRAANVLLVPGRGGIVISEAMAFGLPAIVHQADGTEYDLIENNVTGLLTNGRTVGDFRTAIEYLLRNPDKCAEMGARSQQRIKERFTTSHMIAQIRRAAEYAACSRKTDIGH